MLNKINRRLKRYLVNRRLDIVRGYYDLIADMPWHYRSSEVEADRLFYVLCVNGLVKIANKEWHNQRLVNLLYDYAMWDRESRITGPVREGYQFLFPKPRRP